MRLFLAIDVSAAQKTKLNQQLKDLGYEYRAFRWVPSSNYHITLHFFGEIRNAEDIIKKISEAIYDVPSFHLYSHEADVFINTKILMYLKFRRSKRLELLVERIRDKFNVTTSKRFIPHLTFARYRIPSKQQYFVIKKRLASLELNIDFPVKKIYLFESILENKKTSYKSIAEFELLS